MSDLITNVVTVKRIHEQESALMSQLLPQQGVISAIFRFFHSLHFIETYWHYIDQATVRPLSLGAGVAINVVAGDTFLVRRISQLMLITRSFSQCLEANLAFTHAAQKVSDAFYGEDSQEYIQTRMQQQDPLLRNSPLTRSSFMLPQWTISIAQRIQAVATAVFLLAKSMYYVSHRMMELFEAIIYDKHTEFRAVTGILTNAEEVVASFENNQKMLAQSLRENQDKVEKLLHILGSNTSAAGLLSAVESLEGPAAKLHLFSKTAQQMALESLSGVLSLTGYTPSFAPKSNVSNFDTDLSQTKPLHATEPAKRLGAMHEAPSKHSHDKSNWQLEQFNDKLNYAKQHFISSSKTITTPIFVTSYANFDE